MLSSGLLKADNTDTGKEPVGKLKATLYIGTDGDITSFGTNLKNVDAQTLESFRRIGKMQFKQYCTLGSDTQPIFRSYENWLSPLKPSEEILLSFESRGETLTTKGLKGLRLDLELWQQKRKVMKSDPILQLGKPLLILGPKWREGTLIIAVELVSHTPKK